MPLRIFVHPTLYQHTGPATYKVPFEQTCTSKSKSLCNTHLQNLPLLLLKRGGSPHPSPHRASTALDRNPYLLDRQQQASCLTCTAPASNAQHTSLDWTPGNVLPLLRPVAEVCTQPTQGGVHNKAQEVTTFTPAIHLLDRLPALLPIALFAVQLPEGCTCHNVHQHPLPKAVQPSAFG